MLAQAILTLILAGAASIAWAPAIALYPWLARRQIPQQSVAYADALYLANGRMLTLDAITVRIMERESTGYAQHPTAPSVFAVIDTARMHHNLTQFGR